MAGDHTATGSNVYCRSLHRLNRGEHGRPAGLRTTLLVCLAACLAMLQANLLLGTVGKNPDSFVNFDVMRLPLGILTGVGFIGGGAILRRDNLVLGVTTAATLWFVTVMGLCFGAGQIGLGIAGWAAGMIVLIGLKEVEKHSKENRRAILTVVTGREGPNEKEISDELGPRFAMVRSSRGNSAAGIFGEAGAEARGSQAWLETLAGAGSFSGLKAMILSGGRVNSAE